VLDRTFRHLLAAFFGTPSGGTLVPMNANPNSQVLYIETSIRPGLTIDQYRRSRPQRPTRWERLKQLAGGAQAATA
jgi:hypothetical protein